MQIVRSFALVLPLLVPSLDAQQVLTTDVDVPTILSGPTPVTGLSAGTLGVSSIRTVSVNFDAQNSANYRVYMTVTSANNPFIAKTNVYDWDGSGGGSIIANSDDAYNCRGTGTTNGQTLSTSDSFDRDNGTFEGTPVIEYDEFGDTLQVYRLAESTFLNRPVGAYCPHVLVDTSGNASGNGSTTRVLVTDLPGPFLGNIEAIVVWLTSSGGSLQIGDAVGAAQPVLLGPNGPSTWLSWCGANGASTRTMDLAGLVATALVNDNGNIRRKLFWHGYGPVDAGLVLRPYNFDDPARYLYDASALAGTTFVVRSTPASPLGTEVARIDTCALSSAIVPAATGGPVRFTMVTPFDMPMASKLAVFLVGFPIAAPIPIPGFTGLLGLDPSSLVPFVVSPGSASGSSWAFAVPPLSPGLIHVQSVVLDPSTLGGFFSNRAVLDVR